MEDRAIVFTITPVTDSNVRIYTKDGRVRPEDREVETTNSKLVNAMTMISEILNDEGFAVLFEVD